MKFYKVERSEIQGTPDQILARIYMMNNMKRAAESVDEKYVTMEDRLGDGKCEMCHDAQWDVMPVEYNDINNGGNGKANIQCRNCGYITHL